MVKTIIDVSEWQGRINWEALKPNIDGVIIRCGYGDDDTSQDDKYWQYNVQQCEKLGIPYGVYLYSYANSEAHIKSEIAHVKRLLKGHKPSYPVYIDLEEGRYGGWAKKCADMFCAAISQAGYVAGVYTYESFFNAYMRGWHSYTLWIARFNANDGKPGVKPNIGVNYDAWQYTSQGYIKGYSGVLDISQFYKTWTQQQSSTTAASSTGAAAQKTIKRGQLAADIHKRMVQDERFGYSWEERYGAKEETWTVDGVTFKIKVGDYECGTSVKTAWKCALTGTKYENSLDSYGNTRSMREVFVGSGLFEWKPISFIASPGDLYLNEANHVAMCQRQVPDELSEFSISETGGTTGKRGDQTGKEAAVNPYYDYPWNGILHYNGKADTASGGTSTDAGGTSAKLKVDGEWGKLTTKALQKQLGVKVDGILGPQTYGALRDRIGPKPAKPANRGKFTKPLKKSLQKKLGVTADGVIGPVTIKALQKALNAGKVAKW